MSEINQNSQTLDPKRPCHAELLLGMSVGKQTHEVVGIRSDILLTNLNIAQILLCFFMFSLRDFFSTFKNIQLQEFLNTKLKSAYFYEYKEMCAFVNEFLFF